LDGLVNSVGDTVGVLIEVEMSQHHNGGQEHSSGVSGVLVSKIKTDVTATRLEHGVFATNVAARDDTGTTNETSTNVGNNVTVQVRHDHNVELLRTRDKLHSSVIDNHVVESNTVVFVFLGNIAASAQEQTITEFPMKRIRKSVSRKKRKKKEFSSHP
jgi:hypothetical protein